MAEQLYNVLKTVRPRQWLKNLAMYAALVFSGHLFNFDYLVRVSQAFLIFCALSSAVYVINDILDAPQDRKHPYKRKRPIAAGDLGVKEAVIVAMVLLTGAFTGAYLMSLFYFLICATYFLLNVWYATRLKKVAIVDVMFIAAGFVMRVYGGAVVVDLHLNVWFLLTVISMSLFLAVGKRQSERTLLAGTGGLEGHRLVLSEYSTRLLDVYTTIFATSTWLTYSLFAFQHQFQTHQGELPVFFFSKVPRAFVAQKWLMITVPVVIYGVMRYLQLVYEKNEGESPERVLLSDKPLLSAVILWVILVILILYGLA